jgi:hypothetical protein
MFARVRSLYGRVDRLFPRGLLDVVLQVALFQAGYMIYRFVRGWVDGPQGAAIAFENGRTIIDLQRQVGLFIEPKIQAFFGPTGAVADASSWVYLNAQITVTLAALVFIYMRRNGSFYFVRNMFMIAWGIALLGYVLYPTAPPRFFPEWGIVDSVADFTGIADTTSGTAGALYNPYAAVPSMHVAFALMIGVPLSILARRAAVRWFWRLYPVLVTFVIVVTGNHFLTDALLGALTAGAASVGAVWLARLRPLWAFEGVPAPRARDPQPEPARATI